MAIAIAVIGKENYPLYVSTTSLSDELRYLYIIHTSLDVVEEKVILAGKSGGDTRELYLGLLYPTEDFKVYGYVTNTKIKFIIIVDSSNTQIRDNDIRQMFRRLHDAYTDMLCNPFYIPGEPILSKTFESTVKGIMTSNLLPN